MTNKKIIIITIIFTFFITAFTASMAFIKSNDLDKNARTETTPPTETTARQPDNTSALPTPSTTPSPETTKPEPKRITIVATGDTMLGRGVGNRLISQGRSAEYPFEKIKDILSLGDIIYTNLETSITASEQGLDPAKKYVLKMKPEIADSFLYAGFNMVSLANNHLMDYFERGLVDTMKLLDENNIVYAGAGMNIREARKAAVLEVKGVRVGLLSYTDFADLYYAAGEGKPNYKHGADENKSGVAGRVLEDILEDIAAARDSVDILMIALHWGIEESFEVTDSQREFAYKLLDSGADIILGNHPHQFQGIEIYKGKPIIYSMGNLIMDQNDPENQESFLVLMNYEDGVFTGMKCYPVRTIEKVQVALLDYEGSKNMLDRQVRLSEELDTRFTIKDAALIYPADEQQ